MLAVGLTGQSASQTQTGSQATARLSSPIEPGTISRGVYYNSSLEFSYRLPIGWVDRTSRMQDASADPVKSMVLLGVFGRPPEVVGEGVNSAVVIAAESVSSYPGLKAAAQYFGPLTELVASKGFTAVGEPYEFPVDGKPIVRADYKKPIAGMTMHQSSLAWLAKGYVISFTFIGGNDDEVQQLLEALSFGKKRASSGRD